MPGTKGRSGGKRVGAGRSTFKPTDEQRELVEQLAAFGVRFEEMPVLVKDENGKSISLPTLTKYFSQELKQGKLKANVKVAQTLFKRAMSGENSCIIFWLKTQGGWKEAPQTHEHAGIDGAPIEQRTTVVNETQIKAAVKKLEDEY